MCRSTVVLVMLAVLVAGCGASGSRGSDQARSTPTKQSMQSPSPASPPPDESVSPSGASARGTIVKTAGSEFGTMLFDRRGQAIYLFDKESTSRPDCYGACAKAWPPVLTDGEPRAGGRVRAGLLGTTERRGGATQVSYAGHPLYYYAHESPNEVLCHNVTEFGGLWLVVRPNGEPAD